MKGIQQGGNGTSSSGDSLPSFNPDEPDIPEIEGKKEDEKKRGAAWLSGAGPRGDLLLGGVRAGASSAARSGLLGSGRVAAALSDLFGGSGTFLGGLFASKAGASLVLGGMLAWGGVVLVAGFSLLGRMGGGQQGAKGSAFTLGMQGSGIIIDSPKNRSLNFLTKANQGELVWDKDNPQPQASQETAKGSEKDSAQETESGQGEKNGLAQPQGDSPWPKSFGSQAGKVGSGKFSFQGQASGAGGASMLAGGARGGTPGSVSGKVPPAMRAGGGKLAAPPHGAKRHASSSISMGRGRSSRAMGQAKLARTMSGKGSTASGDASARQYAADAFDQTATRGGQLDAPAGAGGENPGVVVPPGTGAPGGEVDNNLPPPPDAPPPTNATPYQNQLDAAKGMGMQAAMLKMLSMMLILMGLGLIAAGIALLNNHTTFPIGIALICMGVALVAMGIMMMMMAQQMAAAAQGMGDQIKNQYGQDEQGKVVNECSDQAAQNGTAPENCKPATKPDHKTPQVKENIEKERNSNYKIEETRQPQ